MCLNTFYCIFDISHIPLHCTATALLPLRCPQEFIVNAVMCKQYLQVGASLSEVDDISRHNGVYEVVTSLFFFFLEGSVAGDSPRSATVTGAEEEVQHGQFCQSHSAQLLQVRFALLGK